MHVGDRSRISKSPSARPSSCSVATGQLHLAFAGLLVALIGFAATALGWPGAPTASSPATVHAATRAPLPPTTSNAPRTDDGGAGSDSYSVTGIDDIGAVPLPMPTDGPGTGGPPKTSVDGPWTPGPIPSPQREQPAVPSAQGSTVRVDGSLVYEMPVLKPPGKADMENWDGKNLNGTNFNFGTFVGPDSVVYADNMHNPDRDDDGKKDHDPNTPIMEMTAVVESLEEFDTLMGNGLLNAQVWCVVCKGSYK